jgi:hypothetical protein
MWLIFRSKPELQRASTTAPEVVPAGKPLVHATEQSAGNEI